MHLSLPVGSLGNVISSNLHSEYRPMSNRSIVQGSPDFLNGCACIGYGDHLSGDNAFTGGRGLGGFERTVGQGKDIYLLCANCDLVWEGRHCYPAVLVRRGFMMTCDRNRLPPSWRMPMARAGPETYLTPVSGEQSSPVERSAMQSLLFYRRRHAPRCVHSRIDRYAFTFIFWRLGDSGSVSGGDDTAYRRKLDTTSDIRS